MRSNDERGVIYMITGQKHYEMLVVSVDSLMNHWAGPVHILAGDDDGAELASKIVRDPGLNRRENISWEKWDAPKGQKGQQYANKTRMTKLSPFYSTAFLDADTLVVGDINEVFPKENEVVLTRFADWVTTGRKMSGRIERWREFAREAVTVMTARPYPAINTGVLGFTQRTEWNAAWTEMTNRNISFICDELAAQVTFIDHPHRVIDHRWNASVVYSVAKLEADKQVDDVRIWHGHGKKFFKKDSGWEIWKPYFTPLLERNACDIKDRLDQGIGNRQLRVRIDAEG